MVRRAANQGRRPPSSAGIGERDHRRSQIQVGKCRGTHSRVEKTGLKHQYDILAKVLRSVKAALKDNKVEKSQGHLEEATCALADRVKMLKIADTSMGGWDTVNAYRAVPVADDNDDDRKLKKAEKLAKEKMATKVADQKPRGYPRDTY